MGFRFRFNHIGAQGWQLGTTSCASFELRASKMITLIVAQIIFSFAPGSLKWLPLPLDDAGNPLFEDPGVSKKQMRKCPDLAIQPFWSSFLLCKSIVLSIIPEVRHKTDPCQDLKTTPPPCLSQVSGLDERLFNNVCEISSQNVFP
jgi:hypothetical protein